MNTEMIIDAFTDIEDDYIMSAKRFLGYGRIKAKQNKAKKVWRTILIAAIITTLLAITAYATGWFGLSSRVTDAPDIVLPPNYAEPSETIGFISMNGYTGSPEAQAHAEWTGFWQEYVSQHSFPNHDEWSWLGGDEQMISYGQIYAAFDKTMLDKLFEISEKYNVRLHTARYIPPTDARFYKVSGCEPFILSENLVSATYLYEDGSFKCEGFVTAGDEQHMLSVIRGRKGTLDPAGGVIYNFSDYTEWQYTNKSGDEVNIALNNSTDSATGERRAFLFCDKGDYIFTVYADADTQAQAELLAEQFDFSAAAKGGNDIDLESVMNIEAAVAKPKEGLLDMQGWMATDEYKASAEFYALVCEYAGGLPENDGVVEGTMMYTYQNSFASANEEIRAFRDQVIGKYPELVSPVNNEIVFGGTLMPGDAMSYLGSSWVDPRDYPECTIEQRYEMMGIESFSSEGRPFNVICYDNGAFFCYIAAFHGGYNVNYIPKGCFYPLIQPAVNPEITGWAYDTLCGEQAYIVPGGVMHYPVLSYSSIIYETDNAYVIITVHGEGSDAGFLQMVADDIDFTCFK